MISPDSSIFLTRQLEPVVNLCDVGTGSWNLSLDVQRSDWGCPGTQVDTSTFSHDTSVQELSRLSRGASLSDTSLYSTPVDQVNLVAFDMEDHHPALSGLSSSFGISDINSPFPSIAPAQGCGRCIFPSPENCLGLVLTDDPTINHVPQTSDEAPGYFVPSTLVLPSTSYTINHNSRTSYVGQNTEESFKTPGSYAFPSVDNPLQYLGTGQPAARSWVENPSSNLADPAAWIASPSYLEENIQMVNFESLSDTANLQFGQHVLFEEPVSHCEWIGDNGAICGDKFTHASLPGHLSMHGIKNMSRNRPTKCNWVGCRRTRPMNRESILRHIREVHLHLKRIPTWIQEPRI